MDRNGFVTRIIGLLAWRSRSAWTAFCG